VDNVFVERPGCNLEYEQICLKAYDGIAQALASIGRYTAFFNTERRHQSLRRKTADAIYFGLPEQRQAA
jgi:putative transposase